MWFLLLQDSLSNNHQKNLKKKFTYRLWILHCTSGATQQGLMGRERERETERQNKGPNGQLSKSTKTSKARGQPGPLSSPVAGSGFISENHLCSGRLCNQSWSQAFQIQERESPGEDLHCTTERGGVLLSPDLSPSDVPYIQPTFLLSLWASPTRAGFCLLPAVTN